MSESNTPLMLMRSMENSDLELVLSWRNNPEVRRYMFSQHEISFSEHLSWFESSLNNPWKKLLIFENNQKPQGFVSFSEVGGGGVADWGFYMAPDAPKGSGQSLGRTALSYAFDKLNLHKVCGQVLKFNQRSILFHRSLGFRLEGTTRDAYFDGESFHQIYCFGLLCKEWHFDNLDRRRLT